MLQNLHQQQFLYVLSLLDQYLQQKRQNVLLKTWRMLKKHSLQNTFDLLSSSFARPECMTSRSSNKTMICHDRNGGLTTRNQTLDCTQFDKESYVPQKATSIISIYNKQSIHNDFEDIVLQKLAQLENNITKVKSRSNSIHNQSLRQKSPSSQCSVEEGFRFTLNPHYFSTQNTNRRSEHQQNPIESYQMIGKNKQETRKETRNSFAQSYKVMMEQMKKINDLYNSNFEPKKFQNSASVKDLGQREPFSVIRCRQQSQHNLKILSEVSYDQVENDYQVKKSRPCFVRKPGRENSKQKKKSERQMRTRGTIQSIESQK